MFKICLMVSDAMMKAEKNPLFLVLFKKRGKT